jgi:CubicO group peptidase (beta-lactamase class C family)
MKKALLFAALAFAFGLGLRAQSLYFPPVSGNTWDTIQPSSLGWCQPEIDDLYSYLQGENSKAFILLKDGKIVLERYFGTFTQDSLWYWASAGKTLTALTVGIAQQQGLLNIADTTAHYTGAGWTAASLAQEEKITIRHQLTMTSGLDELAAGDPNCTLPTCLPYLADAGTRWAYHTGVYTRLDTVLEVATGQTLNAYINQKIKIPTGMTGSFFKVGYNNLFISKPRSMARFGLLLLAKGQWNGNAILADTSYFYDMTHPSQNLNHSYGYLTWLNGQSSYLLPYLQLPIPGPICPHAPADLFAAIGKNGQLINVVPSQNLVFIRMGNASNTADVSTQLNDTIWQYINRLACSPNALAQQANALRLQLLPNPLRGGQTAMLQFQLAAASPIDWQLLDLQGRIIAEERSAGPLAAGTQQLPFALPATCPAGLYWLRLNHLAGSACIKVCLE